jgi:hypothetical protein
MRVGLPSAGLSDWNPKTKNGGHAGRTPSMRNHGRLRWLSRLDVASAGCRAEYQPGDLPLRSNRLLAKLQMAASGCVVLLIGRPSMIRSCSLH